MSHNLNKSILEAIGETRNGAGILCADPAGLCLAAEGVMMATTNNHADHAAGIYCSIVRLASQMHDGVNSVTSPLITIETDEASTLIKSYDGGHTVAFTVPNVSEAEQVQQQQDSSTAFSEQSSSLEEELTPSNNDH